MTHYQKLATLVFRILAALILAVGVFMMIFAVGAGMMIDRRMGIAIGAVYGPPFLIFGGVFFYASRKLAEWVCYDFEKEPGKVEEV
jgi:uncharacterized membrane protein